MSLQNPHEPEDNALDIIQKAIHGLSLEGFQFSEEFLSNVENLNAQWKAGKCDETEWMRVTETLKLDGPALFQFAKQSAVEFIELPAGWQRWVLPFGPYSVNAYQLPLEANHCLLIDAGMDPNDYFEKLLASDKEPLYLLITHNHRDHVGSFQQLTETYPNLKVYAMDPILCRDTSPLKHGDQIEIGPYQIEINHTPGHAEDGVSYYVETDGVQAMALGDSIYARSAGRIKNDYLASLDLLKTRILGKPESTLLLPGHGPVTTVKDEIAHNPFFAE